MPDEVIYYGWVTMSGVIVHPPVVCRVCVPSLFAWRWLSFTVHSFLRQPVARRVVLLSIDRYNSLCYSIDRNSCCADYANINQ